MADQHDLAEELLARASDDEAAVRALLDVESITDSIVGFHAQQAVEKALKSVLASRGVEFPFIHDLAALMELSDAAGAAVGSELFNPRRLTAYAARLRYGSEVGADVTRAEAATWAAEAIAWARGLVDQSLPRD
jgi:HEPN domain-containing protein